MTAVLVSCGDEKGRLSMGGDPSWISEERAQELARRFLNRNGVTNAEIIGVRTERQRWMGVFSTDSTNPPLKVLVDRKTRVVKYDEAK